MKIVFFGNSDFSVKPLEALIEKGYVIGIVTAPDSVVGRGQQKPRLNPIKELGEKNNIPVFQPDRLKNNTEFFEALVKLQADLHIIVSYGKMIPKEMIDIPKYRTINLHASLLPDLRGAAPIQYSLWKGYKQTGNTVQFITEKMDEGDIISQSHVIIDSKDDYLSLENKLSQDGATLLLESIKLLQQKDFQATPQNHELATYTKLLNKEDGEVFFSMTAEDIVNTYRAFRYRPGVYLPLSIGNVKILECELSTQECTENIGEILSITDDGIIISCDESSILIKNLQPPNKKAMNAKDFANGNRFRIGDILKANTINIQ